MRTLSRRELLGALLGAPLATAACRREPPRPVPGALLGPSMDLGHRVREPQREEPSETREVGVAIVGAGAAGLSAAWRLERAGVTDYVLLELEERAGGTARASEDGPIAHPWGAHYVPLPRARNRALVALLREIGAIDGTGADGEPIASESCLVRAPEERLFFAGRWWEGLFPRAGAAADDLAQLARFRAEVDAWVAFRDARGRRAFDLPMAHGSDDAEVTALDRVSMAAWLDARGFTSARLRWWIEYACRDDYGLALDETSAWAGLFYFASRVARPGAEPAPLLTWPEGNGRLVAHLARVVGDRFEPRRLALDVAPTDAGVSLTVLDAVRERLVRVRAQHAIFAGPSYVARHVVRPLREASPPHLAELVHGPWLVANVHLGARPRSRGFPLAWDNVLHGSPSLGYVVATHQLGVDHGPTVLTWYLPLTGDPRAARERLRAVDHAAACDVVLSDLARAHEGLAASVTRIDAWRWGHAMIQPRPGIVWDGARAAAARPIGRLRFAHCELSGVALFEEAQHRGVAAAESVLEARGVPFERWA